MIIDAWNRDFRNFILITLQNRFPNSEELITFAQQVIDDIGEVDAEPGVNVKTVKYLDAFRSSTVGLAEQIYASDLSICNKAGIFGLPEKFDLYFNLVGMKDMDESKQQAYEQYQIQLLANKAAMQQGLSTSASSSSSSSSSSGNNMDLPPMDPPVLELPIVWLRIQQLTRQAALLGVFGSRISSCESFILQETADIKQQMAQGIVPDKAAVANRLLTGVQESGDMKDTFKHIVKSWKSKSAEEFKDFISSCGMSGQGLDIQKEIVKLLPKQLLEKHDEFGNKIEAKEGDVKEDGTAGTAPADDISQMMGGLDIAELLKQGQNETDEEVDAGVDDFFKTLGQYTKKPGFAKLMSKLQGMPGAANLMGGAGGAGGGAASLLSQMLKR